MGTVSLRTRKVVAGAAVVCVVVGVALWLYPTLVIQNHVNALATPGLTQEVRWAFDGSLAWWTTTYWTVFHPACLVASVAGFTLMASSLLYAWHRHRTPRRTVEDEFHDALLAPLPPRCSPEGEKVQPSRLKERAHWHHA